MPDPGWVLVAVAAALLAGGCLAWRPVRSAWRRPPRFCEARRLFHWQREWLEAKCFDLARARRRPGTPHWLGCNFDDDVLYVRSRGTGELSAFVAMTVVLAEPGRAVEPFEAEPTPADNMPEGLGKDVPGNDFLGATAVFRFVQDVWVTDGRILFNLSPSEAIRFHHRDLEMLGHESPRRQWTA